MKEESTVFESENQSAPPWGARVNTRWRRGAKDWPAWANRAQRERWAEQGLVLWDNGAERITKLTATQALGLLAHLRTTDDWEQHGLEVGEPATTLFLDDPERRPEPSLINEITLSPGQLQEVRELLERYESELQQLSEEEERERSRRLGKVYRFLLDLASQKEKQDAARTDGDSK
jgi:hypothetical protein